MRLPILSSFSKPQTVSGLFNGVGAEGLFDSVNLVCNGNPHTRAPRRAAFLHTQTPDQIINCENRLFFRFGNTIKEIIKTSDGSLAENGIEYPLNEYENDTDRTLIQWEDGLYVLPDKIQVGEDVWYPFGENDDLSVSMPFINARTLFYTSGYSGGTPCNNAILLKVGMKLRFSWIISKDFTIKTIEKLTSANEDGSFFDEGIRVTLDANVPGYSNPPQNSKIKYCHPKNRPILNDLTLGYNHTIKFSEHSILFDSEGLNYDLNLKDYFKIGQTVIISGSSSSRNNTTAKITDITSHTLFFDCDFSTVTENKRTIITITPFIPDFSHIVLTEDRLFGVDNSSGKFHISALKNPFLFYDNPTRSEDAWSVKINGTATALTLWKDNVICFTQNGGFRILGYTALNFGLRQLSINGIKKGCEKSLVRVGDTLYYYSEKGVMKYSGGSDKKISDSVTSISDVKSAITDGSFVYMLTNNRIWVYDTDSEIWWSESGENISSIFEHNHDRYLCTDKVIYITESNEKTPVNWSFELHLLPDNSFNKVQPLYCTVSHTADTDCVFTLYSKAYGETEWQNSGVYSIKNEGIVKIPLGKNHCHGFKIKVCGCGNFSPDGWTVYYRRLK